MTEIGEFVWEQGGGQGHGGLDGVLVRKWAERILLSDFLFSKIFMFLIFFHK